MFSRINASKFVICVHNCTLQACIAGRRCVIPATAFYEWDEWDSVH